MLLNNVAPNIGQKLSSNQWSTIFGAGLLYNLLWRVSVSNYQTQHSYLWGLVVKKYVAYLVPERCRKSHNVWLRALESVLFLFIFVLWTSQPHFSLRLSVRTLVFVWGSVHATILSCFTWPWSGLDSVSYSGCSLVTSVTGLANNSVKEVSVTLLCLFLSICILHTVCVCALWTSCLLQKPWN